ncbi:hypothetical protein [Pedobacter deserti]|uniref:hypothetical protein n=1 Tax=Pedobacter deserti TaxID=2817382 RepID=UPI00210CE4CA|nr:hypothetical protein [Pedobacter sp. SYSU D00382]
MKSLKTTILSLAVLAGVTGALVTNAAESTVGQDPTVYNWTKPGSPNFQGTVSAAQSNYNCSGAGSVCATGTRVSGTGPLNATIRFN